MYYTTLDALLASCDQNSRQYGYRASSIQEYEQWKQALRKKLAEITGLGYCVSAPPDPVLHAQKQREGYTEQLLSIQTEPGVRVSFVMLKPGSNFNGKTIVNPHGHGGGKENILVPSRHTGAPSFAREMAKRGYLVVCPDARGSGERREKWEQGDEADRVHANSHRELNNIAIGFGQCMVAWMVWDLMRLVDYLCVLPQVNPSRIACAGHSGGGQQTLWLSALDDRISLAITTGYFYGVKEALIELPNCACNYVPGFWRVADMGDLGALIAPRPFMVQTGMLDGLNGKSGVENVYPQADITAKAYGLLGAPEKFTHIVHPGGHEFKNDPAGAFIDRWL